MGFNNGIIRTFMPPVETGGSFSHAERIFARKNRVSAAEQRVLFALPEEVVAQQAPVPEIRETAAVHAQGLKLLERTEETIAPTVTEYLTPNNAADSARATLAAIFAESEEK